MTFTDDALLDLDGIAQRTSTFRLDLLDASLDRIGTIAPFRDTAPKVSNNSNRAVKRTLDRLSLDPATTAAVDPFRDRVRATMVLSNGSEFSLGVFLFADSPRTRESWGVSTVASLVDGTIALLGEVETSVAYPAGQSVADALADQFDAAGVPIYEIDPVTTTIGSPIAWPAGTPRVKIMNHLAALAGCYSVYFDNDGRGRVRVVPDLALENVAATYEAGGRIYRGTIVETDDVLDSANRYIVIDSTNRDAPVVGYYDVPAEAPFSFANRGFYVTRTIDAPGVGTVAQAEARARAAYAQDSSTYRWAEFDGPPDPRHDTFTVVQYLGEFWREQEWSLDLIEGAPMAHSLRRVYG